MDIWQRVQILQLAILVASILFGVLFLRMRPWQAGLATILVLPVPLTQLAGGAGSWVFPADVLVPVLLFAAFVGLLPPVDEESRYENRGVLLLALLVLVALPILSTIVGSLVNPQPRAWKFVALPIVRACGFYVVFRMFILRFRDLPVRRFLLLQCLVITSVFMLGLAQYGLSIDLDLWRHVQPKSDPDAVRRVEYGFGFMALYRGAVGAWAAGILAVMPVVMANRGGWNVILPFTAATVLGGVLAVGSRQGLAIGVVAFMVGLLFAHRTFRGGNSWRATGSILLSMLAMALVASLAWSQISGEKLGRYVLRRFEAVFDLTRLVEEAINRDVRIWDALSNVFSGPVMMLIGIGYGLEQWVPVPGGTVMVLVDSEIFSVWQVGGTILFSTYIWFLILVRFRLRRANWSVEDDGRVAAGAGTVVFYASLMLMWGHFSLMTPYAHQATMGYWQWSVLGLALASCANSFRRTDPPYLLSSAEVYEQVQQPA